VPFREEEELLATQLPILLLTYSIPSWIAGTVPAMPGTNSSTAKMDDLLADADVPPAAHRKVVLCLSIRAVVGSYSEGPSLAQPLHGGERAGGRRKRGESQGVEVL